MAYELATPFEWQVFGSGESVNYSIKNAKAEDVLTRANAQRDKYNRQEKLQRALNIVPTRQQLRDRGLDMAMRYVKQRHPGMNRREQRKLAFQMHRDGWKVRDIKAIAKVLHPAKPELPTNVEQGLSKPAST